MNTITHAVRPGRRALVPGLLAGVLLGALLGLGADPALAAYTAQVQCGTLNVAGSSASDTLALRLAPGAPATLQVDVGADGTADFSFDRNTFTAILVDAGGGDDEVRVDQSAGAFADESVTIDGGGGNDTLIGGSGAETLLGGSGNDSVDGNQGSDVALLGTGNDHFNWDPGDGSDTVEGQAGNDVLDFNASNAAETVEITANGPRVRLLRNIGAVVMDLDDLERIALRMLGGADTTIIGNLTGTDLTTTDVDLTATTGGGDTQPDTVIARGTDGPDSAKIGPAATGVQVTGLGSVVRVTGSEAELDSVGVETLGDADTITTGIGIAEPATVKVNGGDGTDTTTFAGTSAADTITVVPNGTALRTSAPASAPLDTTAVENLTINGLGDADTITAANGISTLTTLTIDGGSGNDALTGGDGADTMLGGSGNDTVDGNRGNDTALLGTGNDHFNWDPGDGSDTVEGQAGNDVLDFNASNAAETVEITANGPRVRLLRNIGAVVMDLDDLERIALRMLGGADTTIIGNLTGTDLTTTDVDLTATTGGGDTQPDTVIARGTDGPDSAKIGPAATGVQVTGLGSVVRVTGSEAELDSVGVETLGDADTITTGIGIAEPATVKVNGGDGTDTTTFAGTSAADTITVVPNGTALRTSAPASAPLDTTAVENLTINGLGDADTITAANGISTLTTLTIDGGSGNDALTGGDGADTMLGGSGNDTVDGNRGNDTALLGTGNDHFNWDPGDGSDTVEGQAGNDVLDFNASNAAETVEITANGPRARLLRNIGAVVMDLDDLERIALRMLGGADTTIIGDLTGTDLTTTDIDLTATTGGGDTQPDTVITRGSDRPEKFRVTRSGPQVIAAGPASQTRIVGSEQTLDTLRVETLGGDDDVTVAADVNDLIATVVDLGADE